MVDCKECKNYNICEIRKMVEGKLKRCQSFEQKKPQTNADRIRAMSDEELAKFIDKLSSCSCCGFDKNECKKSVHCRDGIMQWLKSEAKE